MAAPTAYQPIGPGAVGHADANRGLKTGLRGRNPALRKLGNRQRCDAGRLGTVSGAADIRRTEGGTPAGRAPANPCPARQPGPGLSRRLAGRRRAGVARGFARRGCQGQRCRLELQPASDARAGRRYPSFARGPASRHRTAGCADPGRGAHADAATARYLDRGGFRYASHADETPWATAMPKPCAGLSRLPPPANLSDDVRQGPCRSRRARTIRRVAVPRRAPRSVAARTPPRKPRRRRSTQPRTDPGGTGKGRPAPPAR